MFQLRTTRTVWAWSLQWWATGWCLPRRTNPTSTANPCSWATASSKTSTSLTIRSTRWWEMIFNFCKFPVAPTSVYIGLSIYRIGFICNLNRKIAVSRTTATSLGTQVCSLNLSLCRELIWFQCLLCYCIVWLSGRGIYSLQETLWLINVSFFRKSVHITTKEIRMLWNLETCTKAM